MSRDWLILCFVITIPFVLYYGYRIGKHRKKVPEPGAYAVFVLGVYAIVVQLIVILLKYVGWYPGQ